MNMFGARSFAHGIHPPASKDDTRHLAIRQFPFAPVLVVPLSQHIGKPAKTCVREGEEVVRGQCIAEPDGFMSVAMHAPATGTVRRIARAPSITGKMTPAIYLEPFPASTQELLESTAGDSHSRSRDQIISAIQQAGLVGLGGAAFPTHAKLKLRENQHVDTILINGAECEPYLTTDHRVMLEHAADVVNGIEYLLKASGAAQAIVAIESNKRDAAESISASIASRTNIRVEMLPVKYPQGAEKILIKSVLNREVPSGKHPVDIGVLCHNVTSTAEIGMLLPHGAGLQDRVLTVGGPAVKHKGNYRVPIGTPLRFLLETVGLEQDATSVFLGGPMMGQAVSSLDIPITKGTTGVIAFGARETGHLNDLRAFPCIRCGYCVDACPLFLNPAQLGALALSESHEKMAGEYHLFDCFECGCCTYVCPSHIPLVQHFRIAKSALRKKEAAK